MMNLLINTKENKKTLVGIFIFVGLVLPFSAIDAEQYYSTPISSQSYSTPISSQSYSTPISSQSYSTPLSSQSYSTPLVESYTTPYVPSYSYSYSSPSYSNYGYSGGYKNYSNFGGYTSTYSYETSGSTYNPTWKPNTAGWTTDYRLGYSTDEQPASNVNTSWNPDTSGWNTDYRLTYNTNSSADYRVICVVDDTTVNRGDEVEFTARVIGGSGDYEYEWFGDDADIDSDDDSFEHEFDRNGIYRVSVEVTDEDGYTTYDDCDNVYVGRDNYTTNYVQDYYTGGPDGELASVSSVYLNQVPYTGAEDTAKVVGFTALLIVWSSAIAYFAIYRKRKTAISNRIADFKKANLAARG